ncbi:unnamed protein product [Leptidea sinapis]|uniref:Peptidase M14 domain-containing protein n=1 Tax=Leptidea sinapis TaxID=189913 RepID=A0A5E4Q6U5_9NEOP|nr:unnamed protein product [Leptidea sinapis]
MSHSHKNQSYISTKLTSFCRYFLPVVNPDGYEYSHTVERMWRKNRAWHGGKCVGVDLNRNFSYGWGESGSSDVPTHNFFRGPAPFSEPESTAMKVYITLHSYGQIILFPFAYKSQLCQDYVRLLEGATVMSKAIHKCNGNIYKVGISRDVMYSAAGTSNDWSYGEARIPYCYLIELRSRKHKFKLPKEEIEETGNEILNCVKALMEFVDANDVTINIWKEEFSTMDVMVEGPRAAQVASMMQEREIPFAVAVGDVAVLIDKEQGSSFIRMTMDWERYHRLDVIYEFMENLQKEFPFLCALLKISNGNPNNTGIWMDGAIHPREWVSISVVTFIADRIVRTFNDQPASVTNKDWYVLLNGCSNIMTVSLSIRYIVPVLNPDGYEYTHTTDRMWRKNRSRYGECVAMDGVKRAKKARRTIPEKVILKSGVDFKVFLSFHSYGEVIIFPWGYTSDACPDYVELLEGGTAMAKAIFQESGHTYKVGSTKDLMYYAAGTSIDWSYGVANVPFSYMIELRGKKHRFLLPSEEIVPTARETMNGVLSLLDFVDSRCRGTQSK